MKATAKAEKFTIGSTVIANRDRIPSKYTCDGENINPPLTIENIPEGTKTLALIVDDPDAANGTFDHWIVWNIRPMEMISENTVPGTEGKNSFGKTRYQGPCPPHGEEHRYFFKVHALDTLLDIAAGSDKKTVEKAMKGHILAEGEIIGIYKRQ
jgi:Raf kinase inhibitor-like YbhB/YbcL family protein